MITLIRIVGTILCVLSLSVLVSKGLLQGKIINGKQIELGGRTYVAIDIADAPKKCK